MAPENVTTLRVRLSVGQASFEAEGQSAEVRKLYEQFRDDVADKIAVAAGLTTQLPSPGLTPGSPEARPGPAQPSEDTDITADAARLPLPGFLKLFKAETNAQRASLIATWIRHNQGKEEISTGDVESTWRQTRWAVPTNLPRDLTRASTEGLLHKESRGTYTMTGYGESELENLRAEQRE